MKGSASRCVCRTISVGGDVMVASELLCTLIPDRVGNASAPRSCTVRVLVLARSSWFRSHFFSSVGPASVPFSALIGSSSTVFLISMICAVRHRISISRVQHTLLPIGISDSSRRELVCYYSLRNVPTLHPSSGLHCRRTLDILACCRDRNALRRVNGLESRDCK